MLPFVLFGLSALAGTVGAVSAAEGVSNFKKAKKITESAQRSYERTKGRYYYRREKLKEAIESACQLYLEALRLLEEFAEFMESLGSSVVISKKEKEYVSDLTSDIRVYSKNINALIEVEGIAKAGISAAVAGFLAYAGAVSIGTAVGTASTGTAIATLSGAAYTNALLAWFGGGALASGGGGIALGTVVLGGIALGPALCVGGLLFEAEMEKALTEAKEYEAQMKREEAKIEVAIEELITITRKVEEATEYKCKIKEEFRKKLNEVSRKEKPSHKEVMTLVSMAKVLKEAVEQPIIDPRRGI